MNFKKITAGVLAVLMMSAGLVSCGDKKTSDSSSKTKTETQTVAPKVTLEEESKAEEESEAESEADSKAEDGEETKGATPVVWKATSPEGDEMYMMGSMHALKEECYPLPDYVMKPFEEADRLAVECDITDMEKAFAASSKYTDKMMYKKGDTVEKHISKETYDGIKSYIEDFGVDFKTYEVYTPFAMFSIIQSLSMTDAELDAACGLDTKLLLQAHDEGKEIYEVESMEFQNDLLYNFGDEIYDMLLKGYSKENREQVKQALLDMYNGWKSGDIELLEKSLEAEGDQGKLDEEEQKLYDKYNKQMITDRNKGMAEKIEKIIGDGKKTFYVVGAAHFIGKGGILELLEKDGYKIEVVTAENFKDAGSESTESKETSESADTSKDEKAAA